MVKKLEAVTATVTEVDHDNGTVTYETQGYTLEREVITQLSAPLTKEEIKERYGWKDKATGKVVNVEYIEWSTVIRRLNDTYPAWSMKIIDMQQLKGFVKCEVELTIAGITRPGVGTLDGDDETAWKGAASDALKRAAAMFGVALELYEKAGEVREAGASKEDSVATQNQIKFINDLCDKQDKDSVKLSKRLFNKDLKDLRYSEASKMIDELKGNTHATEAAPPRAAAKEEPVKGVSIDDDDSGNTEEGDWRKIKIHFGKHSKEGLTLGDLAKKNLRWYAQDWQPTPYQGKISDNDALLRRALDQVTDEDLEG